MAQHDYNIANQGFPAFRSDLNNALSAIQTTNSGTSRPTGAVAGQLWLDTTTATSPTLKYYDGADDISLATIDHSANTVNWLDSTVSITGLSTTATGTVLTLTDSASTSTVNLIIDNQKEIRFRETTANGTNYVALKAPASVSADLTFTLPATDGTSGQVLQTNGSGVLSFATVGGLAWQTIVTGATLTAVASRGYWIDTTSNACTVTLPASATNGDTIILADYARNWGTNAVTINPNSLNFQGNTSPNPIYNTSGQSVTLVYSGATLGWIPTVDDDVTLETPQSYSVEMLVVAGGGAGGQAADAGGGGGGAGGFRTSTQDFTTSSVYTITVGAGGAKGTANSSTTTGQGGSGGDSSVSGSGITTITSTGGGGGGAGGANNTSGQAGKSGGSGGGTGAYGTNVGGAGNTPSTSPSQGNNGGHMIGQPYNGGGGGGGANAVGGNSTTNLDAGAGGNGTASSITGSSVTYAGGGGGGVANPNPTKPIAGGTGGGGAGAIENGANGVAGTANTGGGGGGGYSTPDKAAAGGSGVVILRMLTTKYSGTTTGSPTVTTDGSYKVLTYTGSGSYTA
jgi:hypothetical protein